MLGFMLKQSDSQIIFWFMHDVVAYGNSSLFFMFKTYEKPINTKIRRKIVERVVKRLRASFLRKF